MMNTELNKEHLKAIAFDFGGTLDTPFLHWMDVYLQVYAESLSLHLTRETFRPSYVYAEQQMEKLNLVKSTDTLFQTQRYKVELQFRHLAGQEQLPDYPTDKEGQQKLFSRAAAAVTAYAVSYVEAAKPVLEQLSRRCILLLVSNYYGNVVHTAAELGIAPYFYTITDSTVEGVRKPDPRLWDIAIRRAGFVPSEVLVVGDSLKNDIIPALTLGCQAVQGIPATAPLTPADPALTPTDTGVPPHLTIRDLKELTHLL
jgi:putative hydrolase of the HAD superfamily